MICEKCGATLPEDATFCGECGAKVVRKKKNPAALEKAKAETKKFKITSIILACLCVVLGICWMVSSHDPYRNLDKYEEEAADIDRAGIELTGMYVVGEDEELPAGRYNIYPPDGESYMDVNIYDTKEDAKKKYDKDYNSLATARVFSLSRGYKLKEGQIVVIDYGSAYFELVSEQTTETESTEPSETSSTGSTDSTGSTAPAETQAGDSSNE